LVSVFRGAFWKSADFEPFTLIFLHSDFLCKLMSTFLLTYIYIEGMSFIISCCYCISQLYPHFCTTVPNSSRTQIYILCYILTTINTKDQKKILFIQILHLLASKFSFSTFLSISLFLCRVLNSTLPSGERERRESLNLKIKKLNLFIPFQWWYPYSVQLSLSAKCLLQRQITLGNQFWQILWALLAFVRYKSVLSIHILTRWTGDANWNLKCLSYPVYKTLSTKGRRPPYCNLFLRSHTSKNSFVHRHFSP
jgi:hypothetical protein